MYYTKIKNREVKFYSQYPGFPLTKEAIANRPDWLDAKYDWYIVLGGHRFDDLQTILAFICFDYGFKEPNDIYIKHIEVNENFRGEKIGSNIIKEVIRRKGKHPLTLTPRDIFEKESPLTDKFYPSLGFVLACKREDGYNNLYMRYI